MKNLLLSFVLLAIIGLSSAIAQTTFINEDFESYSVGTFPSAGGWVLQFNGTGNNYQIVSNTQAHSGTKCMQLNGQVGWTASMYKPLSQTPGIVYFEAYMMTTTSSPSYGGSLGLQTHDEGTWGTYYASTGFTTSDSIGIYLGNNPYHYVHFYNINQWYKVKIKYDYPNNLVSIWINDTLKAANLVGNFSTNGYHDFYMVESSGSYFYIDDIKVCDFDPCLAPMIVTQPINNISCSGADVMFFVNVTGENLSYQWQHNGIDILSATNDTLILNGITLADSGIYTCYISNYCVNVSSNNALLKVNSYANAGQDQTVCSGTSVTLTATGGINYNWNNGITNGIPFVATTTLTYTVTVSDTNGCSSTDAVIVTVNPLPTVFNVTGGGSICSGGAGLPICLDSSETSVNYQLLCNGVNTGSPIAGIGSLFCFGNQFVPGNYTVNAVNINTSCTNYMIGSIPVSIYTSPIANAGIDQTIYNGTSTTLMGSASGGTGPYLYSWVPSGMFINPNIQNPITVNLNTSTVFTVTVMDMNGCTATDQLFITVAGGNFIVTTSSYPTIGGTTTGSDTYPYNQLVTVTASANPGYSFVNWSENGLQVSASSSYSFYITDNNNLVAHFNHNNTPDIYVMPTSLLIYENSKKDGDFMNNIPWSITNDDLLLNKKSNGMAVRVIVPKVYTDGWRANMLSRYSQSKTTVIDWSPYDSPVRDQQQCGSCWAFAAVALLENINNHSGLIANPDFSEQEIVSCVPNHCSGGWYWDAFNYVKQNGLVPENCFPYVANNSNCSNQCPTPANIVNISQFTYYLWGGNPVVNDLRLALQQGPLCVAMYVPNSFFNYQGGIYNYQSGSYQWGHAILLVGYDDNQQYFKAKNSWGSNYWGEGGYFRIAYDDVTDIPKFGSYASYAQGIYLVDTSAAVSKNFMVKNLGGANLIINSITSNKSWLSISPQAGTILSNDSAFITATISDWSFVTHPIDTATVTINSNDSNEPNTIIYIVAVKSLNSAPPQIMLSTDFYQDSELPKTMGSVYINLNIVGLGNVNWTASTTDNWLSIVNSSGTNAGIITVNYYSNSTGNARTGYVTISSPDVSNSPQIVSITQGTNHAPVIADVNKTLSNTADTVHFINNDFTDQFTDADGNSLQYIRIITLPDSGVLLSNSYPVVAYQTILLNDIQNLVFVPVYGWNGNAFFEYNASDGINFAVNNANVYLTNNANTPHYEASENIIIYPNPVMDKLTIQTSLTINCIKINDITGKLLYTTISKTIDFGFFAKGVYFIWVETEQGVVVKKFIKE